MLKRLLLGLAVVAALIAAPIAMATFDAPADGAPCVCCGDACTCDDCSCDDDGCACSDGGACACDSCSAGCCSAGSCAGCCDTE